MSHASRDRRRSVRLRATRAKAVCSTSHAGGLYQVCDLSRGGALIEGKPAVAPGTRVSLRVLVPGVAPMTLGGLVIRESHESSADARMAVKFTSVSPDDEDRFADLIAREWSKVCAPRCIVASSCLHTRMELTRHAGALGIDVTRASSPIELIHRLEEAGSRCVVAFVGSTLGGCTGLEISLLTEDEGALQQTLFELAVRDGLTGVFNRPSLAKLIDDALRDASVDGHALSLLMIDLDHFKQVNDELGHAAGDEILRAVAEAMLRVVRTRDSVARYGGEEFVVLARETERADDYRLAERLRLAIAGIRLATERGIAMTTASIGIASLSECEACHGAGLLELADARMYEAKRLGRNRVFPVVL